MEWLYGTTLICKAELSQGHMLLLLLEEQVPLELIVNGRCWCFLKNRFLLNHPKVCHSIKLMSYKDTNDNYI